jgi:hypothetical protein
MPRSGLVCEPCHKNRVVTGRDDSPLGEGSWAPRDRVPRRHIGACGGPGVQVYGVASSEPGLHSTAGNSTLLQASSPASLLCQAPLAGSSGVLLESSSFPDEFTSGADPPGSTVTGAFAGVAASTTAAVARTTSPSTSRKFPGLAPFRRVPLPVLDHWTADIRLSPLFMIFLLLCAGVGVRFHRKALSCCSVRERSSTHLA